MDTVGTMMFAAYTGFMIIILMNMLIATMSHQYDVVQTASNAEWRYARCKLWMWYIEQDGCLPVPLNLIPDAKTFKNIGRFFKSLFFCELSQSTRREETHTVLQVAKKLQYVSAAACHVETIESCKPNRNRNRERLVSVFSVSF